LTLSNPDISKSFKKMIILLFIVVVISGFFIPTVTSFNRFADDIEGTSGNDGIEGTDGADNIDSGTGDDSNIGENRIGDGDGGNEVINTEDEYDKNYGDNWAILLLTSSIVVRGPIL
jgi:hypothetical protein